MPRINILGSHLDGDDVVTIYKNYHAAWRATNRKGSVPFFALFEGFKDNGHLAKLDAGALRLYLYFGFAANNQHGDSWHSVETIADHFGKQTRTIDTWIRELVDAGLIYRTKDNRKSSSTFLIPYSDTLIPHRGARKNVVDLQGVLDEAVADISSLSEVYGPIHAVFHVFHWGTTKGRKPSEKVDATNFLFIITKRISHNVLIGHVCELKDYGEDDGISKLYIDDVSTFESPVKFKGKPVTGIAVRHNYRLKLDENQETLLYLLRDLSQATPEALKEHPKVEYGLIEDVLEDEGDTTEDDD